MDLGAAVLQIAEANGLTQSNVRAQLSAALRDAYEAVNADKRAQSVYCSSPWLVDIIGDDTAGVIVYSYDEDLLQCAYVITSDGATRTTKLTVSTAVEVMPRTVYDLDGGTTIESKRKEAAAVAGETIFAEAIEFVETPLQEAAGVAPKTDYKIKVIQAGQGSSAFYPKEVLQRDGPAIFKAGTHMLWNHPTRAEEAGRPEGDLNNLAAVLTSDAYWDESGAKGPGLYANAKVFADYATKIADRASNIGVSIRAYGEAETAKSGGPLTLKKFTRAESVDFVTKPGAGGAVLTESAKGQPPLKESPDMEKDTIQTMINESMKPLQATIETQRLTIETQGTALGEANKRALKLEARAQVAAAVKDERLPEAAKLRVVDVVLAGDIPATEAGVIDATKFAATIAEAVKKEGEYLASIAAPGIVRGMGTSEAKSAEIPAEKLGEAMLGYATGHAPNVNPRFAESYAKGR